MEWPWPWRSAAMRNQERRGSFRAKTIKSRRRQRQPRWLLLTEHAEEEVRQREELQRGRGWRGLSAAIAIAAAAAADADAGAGASTAPGEPRRRGKLRDGQPYLRPLFHVASTLLLLHFFVLRVPVPFFTVPVVLLRARACSSSSSSLQLPAGGGGQGNGFSLVPLPLYHGHPPGCSCTLELAGHSKLILPAGCRLCSEKCVRGEQSKSNAGEALTRRVLIY